MKTGISISQAHLGAKWDSVRKILDTKLWGKVYLQPPPPSGTKTSHHVAMAMSPFSAQQAEREPKGSLLQTTWAFGKGGDAKKG